MSGSIPKCVWYHTFPEEPNPVWTSSNIKGMSYLVQTSLNSLSSLNGKYLSPKVA